MVIDALGRSDPLIKDALIAIVERGDFIPSLPDEKGPGPSQSTSLGPQLPIENDPAIVLGLIKRSRESIAALKQNIRTKSGPALFDFILEDNQQSKQLLFDAQNMAVIRAAMDVSFWINEKIEAWLGEKNVADTLSQSVPDIYRP